jgi:hypothetical protein
MGKGIMSSPASGLGHQIQLVLPHGRDVGLRPRQPPSALQRGIFCRGRLPASRVSRRVIHARLPWTLQRRNSPMLWPRSLLARLLQSPPSTSSASSPGSSRVSVGSLAFYLWQPATTPGQPHRTSLLTGRHKSLRLPRGHFHPTRYLRSILCCLLAGLLLSVGALCHLMDGIRCLWRSCYSAQ